MNIKNLKPDLFDDGIPTMVEGCDKFEHKTRLKPAYEKPGLVAQVVFVNENGDVERCIICGYQERCYIDEFKFEIKVKQEEKFEQFSVNSQRGELPPSHPRPPEDELKEFRKYIATHTWKASKTMNNFCPHEYIINYPCWKKKEDGRCSGFCTSCKKEREAFEHWALFIRKYGERQKMLKTVYTVFCVDKHQYWTMGDPMNTTWVLNRGLIDDPNRVPKVYWLDRV